MFTDHRKVAARLAWALYLLCVGLAAGALLVCLPNGEGPIGFVMAGDAAIVVLVVSFSVVGPIVASHRPANPIGWIFCTAALFQGIRLFGQERISTGWARSCP